MGLWESGGIFHALLLALPEGGLVEVFQLEQVLYAALLD
jgi:hypothetical protein